MDDETTLKARSRTRVDITFLFADGRIQRTDDIFLTIEEGEELLENLTKGKKK